MAQINQITKIRLNDGTEVAIVDWSHRTLYSTFDMLSGMTDIEIYCFTYVESDPVSASANITGPRNATLTETNINQPGQMDATEECLVYGMACEAYAVDGQASGITNQTPAGGPLPTMAALAHVSRRVIMELEVSQKAFLQAGFGWFAAGQGPFVAAGGPGSATETRAINGTPGHMSRHNVQIPVHIGGTEKFKVIGHNAGGAALDFDADSGSADTAHDYWIVRVNLDVLHKRPTG